MISEKIVLQFNTQKICCQSFVGGVVKNFNTSLTVTGILALLCVNIIIDIVKIAVEKFKFSKKTKKIGKYCCCDRCYSCGVSGKLMSKCNATDCRLYLQSQDKFIFMRLSNNINLNNFNWHPLQYHHQDYLAVSKKCNYWMTIAKRFASMMRV